MRTNHDHRRRLQAGAAALALQLGLGWILILGLSVPMPRAVSDGLKLFRVPLTPVPPSPAPRPSPAAAPRRAGMAAPPNRTARATELAAPKPLIPPPAPPPMVVAPVAHDADAPIQGAAPLPGPGTGAGGRGEGFGSGDGGDGDGGGGGGSPLRHVGGRITYRDYPPDLLRAHRGGTVWVRYVVEVDGRVHECRIQRSSGYTELDATTCNLIVDRFKFKPKRDARGKKVPALVVEDHRWVVDDDDAGDEER